MKLKELNINKFSTMLLQSSEKNWNSDWLKSIRRQEM